MKTSLQATIFLASLALAPVMAHAATIAINLSGGVLYKNNGTTPLPTNSTIVMLADVDGDGFGNLTQATSSFKGDPDDVIVARFGTNDFGDAGAGTFAQPLNGITVPSGALAAGNPLLVVWYDKTYNVNDTGPGSGVFFGQYRTDSSSADGSNWNFTVPATGTKTINFLTQANFGSLAESVGRANQQTVAAVPEPASMALLLSGGIMLALRRRRKD